MGEEFYCFGVLLLLVLPIVLYLVVQGRAEKIHKRLDAHSNVLGMLERRIKDLQVRLDNPPSPAAPPPETEATRPTDRGSEGTPLRPPGSEASSPETRAPVPPASGDREDRDIPVARAVPVDQDEGLWDAKAETETVLTSFKTMMSQGERSAEPPASSVEEMIGKRGLTWAGAAILFFAAIFFLRHAFANRLFGPTMQVSLSAMAGGLLLAAGYVLCRRALRPLGQGLTGLGQAVLYAAFAVGASTFYNPPVLGRLTAMVLLGATTAVGFILALSLDALSTAIIALLGGLVTPLMVATHENPRDALFAYLLVLNAGTLLLAVFKRWRSLDVIAMVGVYGLFAWWRMDYYTADQWYAALGWAGMFYLFFLAVPLVCHLKRREPFAVERFLMMLANALWFFFVGGRFMAAQFEHGLAILSLLLGAVYLACAGLLRVRLPGDRRSLLAMLVLGVSFLTAALWLYFKGEARVAMLAIEAIVLMQFGWSFDHKQVRAMGWVALAMACLHTIGELLPPADHPYRHFFSVEFFACLVAPAAMLILALMGRIHRPKEGPFERQLRSLLGNVGALLLAAMTFWNAQEAIRSGYFPHRGLLDPVVFSTWYWTTISLGFLLAGLSLRSAGVLGAGSLPLIAAMATAALAMQDRPSSHWVLFLNLRFAMGLFVFSAIVFYGLAIRRNRHMDHEALANAAGVYGGLAATVLLVYLSLELFGWADSIYGERRASLMLTGLWTLYGLIALLVGFCKSISLLRYASLGLLGVSALKLFLADMAGTSDLLRFTVFLGVGVLFMAGAFAYNRYGIKPDSDDSGE